MATNHSADTHHLFQNMQKAIIDLMAGALGGGAGVYVGQPLDTVKVKLQTFPHFYSGMVDCFSKTFNGGGMKALYAGTVPSLIAQVGENATLFCAYGVCQRTVSYFTNAPDTENLTWLQNAFSGAFAAFFSSLVLCPTEMVKCRMQAMHELQKTCEINLISQGQKPSLDLKPWAVTKGIISTNGFTGLFRGLTSTLAREMPGYFFFFGGYEASKSLVCRLEINLGLLGTGFCGGMAGVCFWASVYPADMLKSQAQVSPLQNSNVVRECYNVLKAEGVFGLYKGFTPAIIRTFPATAALFITYEYSKSCMEYITSDQ